MQITYELSERDFVEAYSAHRDRKPFGKWAHRIIFWLTLLFVLAMLFGLIAHYDELPAKSYLPLTCLTLLFILALDVWPRWAMKRLFRKQPGAHGPRTATFDSVGAHWHWNGGSADIEWKNYIRWVESKNQILFYTSPAGFNILPMRTLRPTDLAELRELLQQNIQPEK